MRGEQSNQCVMAMTADDILVHPALGPSIRSQAQSLLLMPGASPRIAWLVATQQRWLMAHAAVAQYFRNEASAAGTGLLPERVVDVVERHELASRNTAIAFLKEMLKYDIIRFVASSAGKRSRPVEPAPAVLTALSHWHALHLATLDRLDGGARAAHLQAQPALLGAIQPLVADGLIAAGEVRKPQRTLSLFTSITIPPWSIHRLIAGCQQGTDDLARIPTDVTSVSALAQRLNVSRTQLSRKFAEAEAMGSLGWYGRRGKSQLWVSADFRREYHAAQAVKLAIVDAAFEACAMHGQSGTADAAMG